MHLDSLGGLLLQRLDGAASQLAPRALQRTGWHFVERRSQLNAGLQWNIHWHCTEGGSSEGWVGASAALVRILGCTGRHFVYSVSIYRLISMYNGSDSNMSAHTRFAIPLVYSYYSMVATEEILGRRWQAWRSMLFIPSKVVSEM